MFSRFLGRRTFAKFSLATLTAMALLLAAQANAQVATWNAAGNLTTGRAFHTATLLQDGTVLVAGGETNTTGGMTASAEIYNPISNTWAATGSMLNIREGHTATLLSDGRVLVVGGGAGATAEIYNPSTQAWSATGSLNAIRVGQSASLLQNGMVLVAGGCCASDGFTSLTSSELWNPATGQWTLTGNMVAPQAYQTATVLSDGTVLVEGGTFYRTGVTSAAEIYNPSTGTWTAVGYLNVSRSGNTASLLLNDQVLAAGGSPGGCCSGLTSAELYAPTSQTWKTVPAMSTTRNDAAAAAISGGTEALVAGGYSCCDSPNPTRNSAEIFNVTTNTWSLTASMSQARYGHTLTTLNDGTALAAGGVVYGGGGTAAIALAERFYPGAAPPQVTITSNVASMSFSIAGTGCFPGSYISPTTLSWTPGSSCTVTLSPETGYTFTSWSDGSTANPRTFVAPSVSTTYSFTVSNGAPAKPASIVASGGTPQSAAAGTAFASALLVTVKDGSGNPVSGVTVTFSAPSNGASGTFAGGVKTATSNASGVATSAVFTANTKVGSYTVTAKVSGLSSTASFALTNKGGAAASIKASGGSSQSATVSTAFSSPLSATVKDAGGNPVSGVLVTFNAPASGASGSFAGGVNTATTNSSGVATSAVFMANATTGSYTVSASVAGVSSPANFSLTNKAASSGRHHGGD
jgi:N-acetylneuraminic acid mutarotase